MRKTVGKMSVFLMGLMSLLFLSSRVYGMETDDSREVSENTIIEKTEEEFLEYDNMLEMSVKTRGGSRVAVRRDEAFYSCEGLIFSGGEISEQMAGKVLKEQIYYSLSYDSGSTFKDKHDMTGDQYELTPVGDGDEYYIKFFKTIDIENITEEISSGEGEEKNEGGEINNEEDTTDEDDAGNEDTADEDDDFGDDPQKKASASKIRVTKISHLTYSSEIFHIIYDTSKPCISGDGDIVWDEWVNVDRTANMTFEDNISGILRVIITSGSEVLFEYHQSENKDKKDNVVAAIKLDKEADCEEGVEIDIRIEDRAGNTLEKSYRYYLDKSVPKLIFTGPATGSFCRTDTQLVFRGEDSIMSTLSLEYKIVSVNRGSSTVYADKLLNAQNEELEISEIINKDADYIVTALVKDLAGNKSEPVNVKFRLDKTAPFVRIEGFEKNTDYRSDVNVRLLSTEEFCSDSKIKYKIVRNYPGGDDIFAEEEVIQGKENYCENILLNMDGDYSIFIEGTDAAGNSTRAEASLRVDKTCPALSIGGAAKGSFIKDVPYFTISSTEMFYDSSGLYVLLYRKMDNGLFADPLSYEYSMDRENYSIPFVVKDEGEYLLKAVAYDGAGNRTEETVDFAYDCTSPVVGWLNTVHKKYFKSLTFPKIFAGNITDASPVTFRAFVNASDLKEGDVISGDGKYVIRIIATDAAGNISDETAEFIVDNTAPRIIAKGLGQDGSVKSGKTLLFSLYDKEDIFEKCSYNGKDVPLDENGRECRIKIEGEGQQEIELTAKDEAGNRTEKLFVVNASVFTMPQSVKRAVNTITRSENGKDEKISSVKIDKNFDEKYLYLFIPVFMGILGFGAWKIRGYGNIDTTK